MKTFHQLLNEEEWTDWRLQKVWHSTPSGQRNYVQIKSLSPEDQSRYKDRFGPKKKRAVDNDVKKAHQFSIDSKKPEIKNNENVNPDYLVDIFIIIPSREDIAELGDDELIFATNNGLYAMEYDDMFEIQKTLNVPVNAFRKFKIAEDVENVKDINNIEWEDFPKDIAEKDKYEFIKFEDDKLFMVNLKPYEELLSFVE